MAYLEHSGGSLAGETEPLTLVEVSVPGPWWNSLTYSSENVLPEGVRVSVPMGPSKRIGFSLGVASEQKNSSKTYRIRPLHSVIDSVSPFPQDLWLLSEWIGAYFFCGRGTALKVMSPSFLLKGDCIDSKILANGGGIRPVKRYAEEYCYFPEDEGRYKKYISHLKENPGPALLLFPEGRVAELFCARMEAEGFSNVVFWPSSGGKKQWEAWQLVRSGEVNTVVGGPGAVFAPLPQLNTILVDEESSPVYRMQAYPHLHSRAVAMQRARIAQCSIFLGGRLPSSKVYLYKKLGRNSYSPKSRLTFVDMKCSGQAEIPGISHSIPLSESLVKGTLNCVSEGHTALWILDRKGYAGEISCEECGGTLTCHHCGVLLRAEEKASRLVCPLCGYSAAVPERCPRCGSLLLIGRRPGLETITPIAKALVGAHIPVLEWHSDKNVSKKALRETLLKLKKGGIVVGSRLALSLSDEVMVGLIGWIDADSESRKVTYRSRFDAFRLIWESCWRGIGADDRKVIVQSRRPGKGWQRGLMRGWDMFWHRELKERKDFDFPPYSMMAEITTSLAMKKPLLEYMQNHEVQVMDPGDKDPSLWVFVRHPNALMDILKPWFHISRSKEGFPSVALWID
ncbi:MULTISPECIES: prephenate dehydrogenase [Aminobacterium]|mgnify:CR=1 FL=1|jgi:primosomal protein N' (replication factor Y)|uniref:primosomal protein N' family DNA-binding protein n=1 Tax=Aminobacterium TaxID=81466 RepID=UPI00257DA51D|nr:MULTISPECIES: prephenate dehydrogenase [unclassified Aminobacterium]